MRTGVADGERRGDTELAFRLLGPVGIRLRGRPVRPGPPRQQAVLGILLLRPGQPVAPDELVAGVWGDEAPDRALGSLRTYAWALRALLEPGRAVREPGRVLVSDRGGYTLRVPAESVDTTLFERRLGAAREARERGEVAVAHGLLAEALALWGGEPLSGVPGPHAERQRTRLAGLRLTALERYFACALDLGMHQGAVPELAALAQEHPLDEKLRCLLMRALAGCGRQAEALRVYDGMRRLLADELGVPPGRELTALRVELSTGGTEGRRATDRPARLPPESAAFTAPRAILDQAERVLRGATLDQGVAVAVAVAVITGTGGTGGAGRTALAVQLAHRAADAFPDGQLFADLRGTGPQPADSADILADFLRSLGVPAGEVPGETEQRAALYRSMLAGRRVLVVLADTADAAQVTPLLPGTPGCAVLVTGRSRVLVLPGAVHYSLGPWHRTGGRGESAPGHLPPGQARAFRLLARCGAGELSVDAVAASLGTGAREAERIAEALVDAGLLDTHAPGRYRLHDPLRPE
ncbi:BTAD domain-containing putative transcriptional regulator [Streptomyces sp. NPDC052396]|uniref:AfsR/SARP family transcriptional regulator n=1 Tax=Streptomyces sp. NPDC052396 TaxID=3365689 RepID=UPI0037D10EDD